MTFIQKLIGTLGALSILAFVALSPAVAEPTLGIKLEQPGVESYSETTYNNFLSVAKSIGTFAVNFVTSYLSTSPLALDLSSINISSGGAGTLRIITSATGITSPLGLVGLISQFSGNVFLGSLISATFDTYISPSNTMFGTDALVSSISTSGTPFAAVSGGSVLTSGPYAVTEVITIGTAGLTGLSLDGSATAAPEIDVKSGGAAIALLIGVLALFNERRRGFAAAA